MTLEAAVGALRQRFSAGQSYEICPLRAADLSGGWRTAGGSRMAATGRTARRAAEGLGETTRPNLARVKYSLQGTTQGNGLTGGVPPVRFSM